MPVMGARGPRHPPGGRGSENAGPQSGDSTGDFSYFKREWTKLKKSRNFIIIILNLFARHNACVAHVRVFTLGLRLLRVCSTLETAPGGFLLRSVR